MNTGITIEPAPVACAAGRWTAVTREQCAILCASFVVALGFGTLLPLMPVYLTSIGAAGEFDVSAHTGAVAASFMAAASLAAPAWGHLSDRVARSRIVCVGLIGTALAVFPFLLSHDLVALYGSQILAGVFFAAVLPVSAARLYEAGPTGLRAVRLARFASATLAGYLVGPAIGGLLSAGAEDGAISAHEVVTTAFALQAGLAALAAGFVWHSAIGKHREAVPVATHPPVRIEDVALALAIVALAAFALGGFEVATALHIRSNLGLAGRAVSALFITCALAMIVVQLWLLPALHRASGHAASLWLLLGVGALIAAMPLASTFWGTLLFGALIGGALGLAIGLLGLRVAALAGARRGLALGGQSAVSNAGQALGAAAGAALVSLWSHTAFPFLGGTIVLVGIVLGLVAWRRVPLKSVMQGEDHGS